MQTKSLLKLRMGFIFKQVLIISTVILFILHFTCQGQVVILLMCREKSAGGRSTCRGRRAFCGGAAWSAALQLQCNVVPCVKDGRQPTIPLVSQTCQIMDRVPVCATVNTDLFLWTLITERPYWLLCCCSG